MNQASNQSGRPFQPVLEALESRLSPAVGVFAHQVNNLFVLGLNRLPEPAGLNYWVSELERGQSLGQVSHGILSSHEHNLQAVTSYFHALLGRNPDNAGLLAFVEAADRGVPEEQLVAGFLSSHEHSGIMSDAQYVDWLYLKVLGRSSDAEGFASHLKALAAGTSRFNVALSFLESRELATHVAGALYVRILGREPTPEEKAGWAKNLERLDYDFADGVTGFALSPESTSRLGAAQWFDVSPVPTWWENSIGLNRLVSLDVGAPPTGQMGEVDQLINMIRAVETFSNPDNPGQVVSMLADGKYPNLEAINSKDSKSTATQGLDAYPGDLRNTPGALQCDLANLNNVLGEWKGVAGGAKKANTADTQFAFSQAALEQFFGISVDSAGLITRIGPEAAAVFLNNDSLSLMADFNPLNNSLIGQHIDNFQTAQLSLYLANRSPNDSNIVMASDTRVMPQSILEMDAAVQEQASKNFIWSLYQKYQTHDEYKAVFAKVEALFGSTLQVTSSTAAFGILAGQDFLCRLNPGFIIGGAYVQGEGTMFQILQTIVAADEDGSASYLISGETITITRTGDGATRVFHVDKTPPNVSPTYPSVYHYGAVVSPFLVDMKDSADWGISTQPYTLGYARQAAAVTAIGTATLPSDAGPYLVTYKGLADHQTLTLQGDATYRLCPPAPASLPIFVNKTGYSTPANNNQAVAAGQKIDMSPYGLTIEEAYQDMYYVDTSANPAKVYRVSDKSFTAPAWGMYLYYVNGANGDLQVATDAITSYEVSWKEPFNLSYRVSVPNLDVLGRPDSAQQFGLNFIMTAPPIPTPGTGNIDASSLTGSLFLEADSSLQTVRLGSGVSTIVGVAASGQTRYILNAAMAPVVTTAVFSGLRLGVDQLVLTGFTNLQDLNVAVAGVWDNRATNPAIADYYWQFSNTAVVSFSSDVAGTRQAYRFEVLTASDINTNPADLIKQVKASLVTAV